MRILIKILEENHMTFDLVDKIDIRWHTDRQTSPKAQGYSIKPCLSVCHRMSMLSIKIEGAPLVLVITFESPILQFILFFLSFFDSFLLLSVHFPIVLLY